jgi:Cu+-exporting ATPase
MHQHRLELHPAHSHHDERRERLRYFGFAGVVGLLLLANLTGLFRTVWGIDTAAILTVLAGYRTFYNAVSALLEKSISADLAICIAVIAALAVGEYLAAAEAMFIMLVGEGLEGYATRRTAAAISGFIEKMPRRARLLRDGEEIEVDAASLAPGDTILVRAGERIPADGAIVEGVSSVDESTITGESLPRDKEPGADVFSGTLNGHGALTVRVVRAGEETTLARVIKLVEEARARRAPVVRMADRYAKYFVPMLLLAGALTFYFTRDWMRTVAVLIVGCPCALILATPTAMVAAMGGLARRGILVRGGAVVEQAAKVDTVLFDKTGTLTEGRFEIVRVLPSSGSEDDLLRLAATAEHASDHMLARVIVEEARRRGIGIASPADARILPGRGVECTWNGATVRAGNAAYLASHDIPIAETALEEADRLGATAVLVAHGARFAGAILLRDRIRAGAKQAVHRLEHLEIHYQVMLTGDRRRAAEAIAREVGIPNVEAELLPEQKLDRIRQLVSQGRVTAMAGDGVNDAPSLAAAHVGIAVSGASDITAEAAGVVYMGRSLDKLPQLFDVSRRAVTIVWQNIIVFAFLVNIAAIGLASSGIMGPLGAAFTHQIASFLVMLNSMRLLRLERRRGRFRHWLHHRLGHGRLHEVWHRLEHLPESIHPREAFFRLIENRRRYYRPAAIAVPFLMALNGVYVLGPEEAGVIERFGRKVSPPREPGLHYKLPWPVERLTRIEARRARVIEIGFRSAAAPALEPAAYEWNVQHRGGRFERKPDESLMVSGDQNLMEVNAVVHYRLRAPEDFLFRHADGETTVRVAAESALQSAITTTPLDEALTTGRPAIERRVRVELQGRLDRYRAGVEVLHVKLLDVHPSIEVVDAFRDVSGAFEEKNRLINEAEGYRNEQVALARGGAGARLETAKAHRLGVVNRAAGDAVRFTQSEAAYRLAAGVTETRLYLETMEQILPGRRKMIVDSSRARRHLMLLDDGVEIGPAITPSIPAAAPRQPPGEEERE